MGCVKGRVKTLLCAIGRSPCIWEAGTFALRAAITLPHAPTIALSPGAVLCMEMKPRVVLTAHGLTGGTCGHKGVVSTPRPTKTSPWGCEHPQPPAALPTAPSSLCPANRAGGCAPSQGLPCTHPTSSAG